MVDTVPVPMAQAHGPVESAPVRRWASHPAMPGLAIVALLLVAALIQATGPAVTDVTWLLTVGEAVLSGQRLYVDILEVNPPMSVALYLPAVWLAGRLGIAPDPVLLAGVLLLVGLVLWLAILPHRMAADRPGLADGIAAALVLAVLPLGTFGQREHLALLCLVPVLSLLVRRAGDGPVRPALALVAGSLAGLAVCIKPHFVLAVLLPAAYAAWHARSLRPLLSWEALAAGVVVAAYGAVVLGAYPEFLAEVYPLLAQTYRRARVPGTMLVLGGILPTAGLAAIALARLVGPGIARPRLAVPLLAAAGFALAAMEQGKGWGYHHYPAAALALFALLAEGWRAVRGALPGERPSPTARRSAAALGLAALAMAVVHFSGSSAYLVAAEALRPVIPPHPRMMTVSGDIAFGHPLVRSLGGRWAGRVPSRWITEVGVRLLNRPDLTSEERAALTGWIGHDRRLLAQDIATARPDVILFDARTEYRDHGERWRIDWKEWAMADPAIAAALAGYRPVLRLDGGEAWLRRTP